MSLTSELKNPQSNIVRYLDGILDQHMVDKFIHEHNSILCKAKIIQPLKDSNLMLVGLSMIYAFYYQMMNRWDYKNTIAGRGVDYILGSKNHNHFDTILSQISNNEQKAFISLILSCSESYARNQKIFPEIVPFINSKILPISGIDKYNELWTDSVQDVCNLVDSFNLGWIDGLKGHKIHRNVSFKDSYKVGGADAQMVCNGSLIDIRTSKLFRPFTKKDLYQQLAYCLFDSDNKWNIQEIIWIYPRHQMFLRYHKKQFTFTNHPKLSFS